MNKDQFFENIMTICDWDKSTDDERLSPLVDFLSRQADEEIFSFDDIMAELLYSIDTRKNFKTACKYYNHSDDSFLYSRCVALVNGADYYERVKSGKAKELWESEFEAILYVPQDAWAKKHNDDTSNYPHLTAISYETGSNEDGWK